MIRNRDSRTFKKTISWDHPSSMSNDVSVHVLRKSLTSRKIWGYILSPMCRSVEFEIDIIFMRVCPRYLRGIARKEKRSFSKQSLSHLRILAGSVFFFVFLAIKEGKIGSVDPRKAYSLCPRRLTGSMSFDPLTLCVY